MGSVEAELWNIFTYYTLHGNALDPEHLALTQMVQLARDTQMLDGTLIKTPLRKPDIELVFISEVKRRTLKQSKAVIDAASGLSNSVDKLTYHEFLTCLLKLSKRLYPKSSEKSLEVAFQQLLMENVLPLASRRSPKSIDAVLSDPTVKGLYHYFGPSLRHIFEFYAGEGVSAAKEKAAQRGFNNEAATFDELKAESKARFAALKSRSASPTPSSSASATSSKVGKNTMTNALGYPDFVRLGSDFGLTSKGSSLTMIDIGDIYLAGVANSQGTAGAGARKLKFKDFWEVLVRVSLQAYRKCAVDNADKIRGLMLYMWRQIQTSVNNSMNGPLDSARSTHKGGLLRGCQLFNERFISMWQEDEYKDYLYPQAPDREEGRDVLTKLVMGEEIKVDPIVMPPKPPKGRRGGRGEGTFQLEIENDDESDLNELGFNPDKLRSLLVSKPELAAMLQEQLEEAGMG